MNYHTIVILVTGECIFISISNKRFSKYIQIIYRLFTTSVAVYSILNRYQSLIHGSIQMIVLFLLRKRRHIISWKEVKSGQIERKFSMNYKVIHGSVADTKWVPLNKAKLHSFVRKISKTIWIKKNQNVEKISINKIKGFRTSDTKRLHHQTFTVIYM